MSAVVALKRGPLSPARAELAASSNELAAAMAAYATAAEPVQRLGEVAMRAQQAEARLAELRAEYDQAVGEWVAGGRHGQRPMPSAEQSQIEEELAELAADAAACRAVLPARQAELERARDAVLRAQVARDSALFRSMVDAARELIEAAYRPALAEVARIEGALLGLYDTLVERGHSSGIDTEIKGFSLKAAADVHELVKAANAAARAARDRAPAARLLNALPKDAAAELAP